MEYRSPTTLSYLAMGSIAAVGACELLSAIIGIAQSVDPGRDLGSAGSLWIVVQSLIALLQLPLFVLSAVFFLMWLFRCYKNLPSLGSDSVEFTPGMAVGWWFIPFANLVKPFQAVRNLWSESDPDVEPGSFMVSVQSGAPWYMMTWWITWLIANFTANLASGAMETHSSRDVQFSGYLFILNGTLTLIAALLAVHIVRTITSRQDLRHTRVGSLPVQEPPPPPNFSSHAPADQEVASQEGIQLDS